MAQFIGIVGGSGGVGASTLAATVAAVAGSSLLIDLDVSGGGIDVALGIESIAGARWSGVRLAGGRLDPDVLLDGLPRWGPCLVLAADAPALEPDAVSQVLEAAALSSVRTIVLDLPRADCAERAAALRHCAVVAVLARTDVPGLVAARAIVAALAEPADLPVGVIVRRGRLGTEQAAALLGAPLLGTLPPLGAPLGDLDVRRLPRATMKVAAGVLAGLRAAPGPALVDG